MDGLNKNYKVDDKYHFTDDSDVGFEMINGILNVTLKQLNSLRQRQPKFICINDDISNNSLIFRKYLNDFYNSFHPIQSPLELKNKYNKYLRYEDYIDDLFSNGIRKLVYIIIFIIFVIIILRMYIYYIYRYWNKIIEKCLINRKKIELSLNDDKIHNL